LSWTLTRPVFRTNRAALYLLLRELHACFGSH
jgi:hypothetical protein